MISLRRLPNSLPDEKTILFLRRHWIELLSITFYGTVLLLIPFALEYGLQAVGVDVLSNSLIAPFAGVGITIYLLFVLLISLTQFTDFYLDTWIVTTERIINVEQHGLFSRVISELHLNEIQDVTSETHGFLSTFLTYGDVFIQTSAERQRFNFKNIDNPDYVKEVIIRLVQDDKVRHPVGTTAPPAMGTVSN